MTKKHTHEELIAQVKSHGWNLITGEKDKKVTGTLEEVLKDAHQRHQAGEKPGLVQRIENTIELDMIEIEKLWRALGLPV